MANFTLTRRLQLAATLTEEQRQHLHGLDHVQLVHWDNSYLKISYDVRHWQIIPLVKQLQLQLATSRWQRLKLKYYQFTETNLIEAAAIKPGCCNKPPR